MEWITLDKNISIKKLDPENKKDVWLVNELEKDKLINSEDGYLYPLGIIFNDVRYLFRQDIYKSPYGIYYQNVPVGYIELSDILVSKKQSFIDISYALLKSERGKGYMTKTLLEISKKVLTDREKE